jgi:hypothetical protein
MELTVHFEGLCHFVPFYKNYPDDQVALDKMWVILVNGTSTLEIPTAVRGRVNPDALHYAFVRVSSGNITTGQSTDLLGLWPIHGMDLEVLDLNSAALSPGGLNLKRVAPQDLQKPLTTEEETSYHWVADLGRAAAVHQKISADCLEEIHLDQVPTAVAAARIRLAAGQVSTGFVVRDHNTEPPLPIVFKMIDGSEEFSQALAERVSWRVTVPTDGIVLVRRNRITAVEDRLTLDAVDGRLEILIGNLEAGTLLKRADHRTFAAKVTEFYWFYGLSPNQEGVDFPIPQAEDLPKDGNPYCPVSASRQP